MSRNRFPPKKSKRTRNVNFRGLKNVIYESDKNSSRFTGLGAVGKGEAPARLRDATASFSTKNCMGKLIPRARPRQPGWIPFAPDTILTVSPHSNPPFLPILLFIPEDIQVRTAVNRFLLSFLVIRKNAKNNFLDRGKASSTHGLVTH